MPEGDAVWRTARRLHEALAGRVLTRCDVRVPRFAAADLTGQTVTDAEFGTKIRRITEVSGGGGNTPSIVPMYSTVSA